MYRLRVSQPIRTKANERLAPAGSTYLVTDAGQEIYLSGSLQHEAIHGKNKEVTAHQGTAVLSAPADYLPSIGFKLKRWHADRTGLTPILHGSTNVSWLTHDPAKIVRVPTYMEKT